MRILGYDTSVIETLILANVLMFIITLINPDVIINNLGLQPSLALERPWTLVTPMFLHGGLWHLFANMFTLFFFGNYLQGLIGGRGLLKLYFVGGILGNILVVFWADPNSIAVGASGAIFALGGTLTVLRPNLKVFIIPLPVPIPLWIAVIGGFLVLSLMPFISWQAHLGGLIAGLVFGYYYKNKKNGVGRESAYGFYDYGCR